VLRLSVQERWLVVQFGLTHSLTVGLNPAVVIQLVRKILVVFLEDYSVTVSLGTCSKNQSFTVSSNNTESTAPTSITGTSTICNGGGTTLSVSGGSLGTGASWKWYSGSCGGTSLGTGSSITVNPTTNTTYYVRAEGTCNTTVCAALSVTVNDKPTLTAIVAPSAICAGGAFSLSAPTVTDNGTTVLSQGWEYSSTSGGTYSAFTNSNVPYSYNGYYLRYYATNTCGTTYSGAVQITVNSSTSITAQSTSAQTQCKGTNFTAISVTASGTGTLSYQWYSNSLASTTGGTSLGSANGAQTASYTPQSGTAGTLYYYCVVTGTCGTATSTISGAFVTNALPTPTASSNTPQCAGGTLNLSSSGGTSYSWTGPGSYSSTSQNPSITNITTAASVTYTVTVTNASGCVATATTNVTVNALPIPALTSSDSDNTFCAGASITFTAGGGTNYNFRVNGTSVQNGTSNTYISSAITNGQVIDAIVTNALGCAAISSAIINSVNALPTPAFINPSTSICASDNVVYETQAGQTNYVWNVPGVLNTDYTITSGGIGATNNTVTLKWITSGSKTVLVNYTNSNGCTGTAAQITTTVHPVPQIGSFN